MRVLTCQPADLPAGTEADDDILRRLYAFPDAGGVRSNFVATLDGAATGSDGLSGSINNAADKRIFDLNRELADVVLVGAATLDAENYGPSAGGKPLIAVSNRGLLPRGWLDSPITSGLAVLVTVEDADAPALRAARERLGAQHVWTIGTGRVDLAQVLVELGRRGHRRILTEGGPRVHTELLRRDLLDEVALTWVPKFTGGTGPRIAHGADVTVNTRLSHLLEADGTLLGLWRR